MTPEVRHVLTEALRHMRREHAAGRFKTVTLLTTGPLEAMVEALVEVGATKSELAAFRAVSSSGCGVDVIEEP